MRDFVRISGYLFFLGGGFIFLLTPAGSLNPLDIILLSSLFFLFLLTQVWLMNLYSKLTINFNSGKWGRKKLKKILYSDIEVESHKILTIKEYLENMTFTSTPSSKLIGKFIFCCLAFCMGWLSIEKMFNTSFLREQGFWFLVPIIISIVLAEVIAYNKIRIPFLERFNKWVLLVFTWLIILVFPIFSFWNYSSHLNELETRIENGRELYSQEFHKIAPKLSAKFWEEKIILDSLEKEILGQKEILIIYLNQALEEYPHANIYSSDANKLKKINDGEFVRIIANPKNLHLESKGKINFDFKSTGHSNGFKTGGIFSRYVGLSIATIGAGKGKLKIEDCIDGDYWAVFSDKKGEAFIVKEAFPGHLFLGEKFLKINAALTKTIKNYVGKKNALESHIKNMRDKFSSENYTYRGNKIILLKDYTWEEGTSVLWISSFFSYLLDSINGDNEIRQKHFEKYLEPTNNFKLEDVNSEVRRKIKNSFSLNSELALKFKIQVDSDMDEHDVKYELIGVKTTQIGMPIVNVVSFVKRCSGKEVLSGEIYEVNKSK